MSERFQRQSFLGANSEALLQGLRVSVVGYGGGGSHIGQQIAHVGVGHVSVFDHDTIEDTNLNRLVGGTAQDVADERKKVEIAARVIKGVRPEAQVAPIDQRWHEAPHVLAGSHVVLGAVDTFAERLQLEAYCRRHLIPYIDIGMDVVGSEANFRIFGQVVLSSPGKPCLRCMGLITDKALAEEERARQYGDAGSKPQVVWPNGVLASTAVGLLVQLVTPWHGFPITSAHLEYDGNLNTMQPAPRLNLILKRGYACSHYSAEDVGDALYGMALF